MSADAQVNRWAAKRLLQQREQQRAAERTTGYRPLYAIPDEFEVVSVEFIDEEEYAYSEYTVEPACRQANVTLDNGFVQTIDLTQEDFGDIIREILAA